MAKVTHLLDTDTPEHLTQQIFEFYKSLSADKRHKVISLLEHLVTSEYYPSYDGMFKS